VTMAVVPGSRDRPSVEHRRLRHWDRPLDWVCARLLSNRHPGGSRYDRPERAGLLRPPDCR
jgi:hypothetical protein